MNCVDVAWLFSFFQTLNVTTSQYYINNRLHINGTLTISAVSLNHSGPYTCSAHNDDGVTMATTELRVLGEETEQRSNNHEEKFTHWKTET